MRVMRIIANDAAKKHCELKEKLCVKMAKRHVNDESDEKFKKWSKRFCDAAEKHLDLMEEYNTLIVEGGIAEFVVAGFIEGAIEGAITFTPLAAGCIWVASKINK